ncbi:MAG: hypothetical protein ACTSYB_02835 [Candidatus Helarchaeota archaeon]
MSEETSPPQEKIRDRVVVTSYPKIIYLWPTWALAFFIWLISIIGTIPIQDAQYYWVGWLWFGIFAFNVFVVAFEFSSAKFLGLLAVIFGVILLFVFFPTIIPLPNLALTRDFYLVYTAVFTIVFGLLWISRRFNYLEVTSQQITYKVGILEDERRYPAPSIHFEKQTRDIFERIMPPWSAKLVMRQEGGQVVEILECVPRINKRLNEIKEVLEHLVVRPKY